MEQIISLCKKAKSAQSIIGGLDNEKRNNLLSAISKSVLSNADSIINANKSDIAVCTKPKQFIDRLMLNQSRIQSMADGVDVLLNLPDPLFNRLDRFTTADGIDIEKVSVPLGVVGIVYEARPNVTVDAIALCIKSGNAVVLRGGSDALNSNLAIVNAVKAAVEGEIGNSDFIQYIPDVTHEGVRKLCTLNKYIDVIIPRGSASLIQSVVQCATVPVIETGEGNCHIYIEESADINSAINILINAKTQRPTVCNAAESLLIDRSLLPKTGEILSALYESGVEIRADREACSVFNRAVLATEQDYSTEFLSLTISCMMVDGYRQAVEIINQNSTHHSEAIISTNQEAIEYFTKNVDSAAVYVNASTRFTDGFMYGFGAEMGISTQKLHARGPMGLRELTSYKYIVHGTGQIRK